MPEIPESDAIKSALERIVSSPQLESSPSLCRFLRYVVEETLAGRGGMIKEYSLGVEVFHRGDDFDPRIDPIVRVQARNLRARMAKYYGGPGTEETVYIELPKRTYVPVFHAREAEAPTAVEMQPAEAVAEAPVEPAGDSAPPATIEAPVRTSRPSRRSVARVVAAGILVALVGGAFSLPRHGANSSARASDTAAQDQYIRGRFLLDRHDEKSLRESVAAFERAVARDEKYAAAYAGLADAYNVMSQYGYIAPPEGMEKGRGYAKQSLAIDPHLAEGHVALAAIIEAYDWNWPAAEREYRRALELNPSLAAANLWYGMFLRDQGRIDEALPLLRRAAQLTPVSELTSVNLAYALLEKGSYESALEQAQTAAELEPDSVQAQLLLSSCYHKLERPAEADAALERAEQASADNPHGLSALTKIYLRNGHSHKAELLRARLEEMAKERYVSPFDLATVSLVMGDEDRALALFQEAHRQRSAGMIFLTSKTFAGVRQKEQFQQLLPKMHPAG